MRKRRDDSTWNQLTTAQREALDGWLFDENLGYAETLARARQEFGVAASLASVGRYYRFRARERQVFEMAKAGSDAELVNAMPVTAEHLRTAAVKLAGKAALKLALIQPDEVEALAALTRLLLESEDIAIRRGRLQLAERYYQLEQAVAAQQGLPLFRAYLNTIGDDPSLTHEQKVERVRNFAFGKAQAPAAEPAAGPASGAN